MFSSEGFRERILPYGFLVILSFGLLMLASAGAVGGYFKSETFFFVKRQLLMGVLPGLILMTVLAKLPFKIIKNLSPVVYLGSLVLLILVFIPGIGSTNNTFAKNWLNIFGFSIQPAEFAKLALVWFLAYLIERASAPVRETPVFVRVLFYGVLPLALIGLQPDTGSAAIVFAILFGVLFAAGASLKHLALLAGVALTLFSFALLKMEHARERFAIFWDLLMGRDSVSPSAAQLKNAQIAIASGGLLGVGYAASRHKFGYIPEVHADSIFAILGEEMGLVVALIFVCLFGFLCARLLKLASLSEDDFGRLFLTGSAIWFFVQFFLNVGAMVGVVPLTGVPLPFVSHGGSALIALLSTLGICLNVAKNTIKISKK